MWICSYGGYRIAPIAVEATGVRYRGAMKLCLACSGA
jgi:hypothetical protein